MYSWQSQAWRWAASKTVNCQLTAENLNKEQELALIDRTQIVVVDVEATCWKDSPPLGEQNEIIEVGVCLLDTRTGEIGQKRSLLVKPARSKVSEYCTKLTTITPEMVADGMLFAEACAILESEYNTKTRLWGSWGDYDRRMFESQCASFAVPYPFSTQHVNIKALFAEVHKRGSKVKQVGMLTALRTAKLNLQGTHHRGDDDAWNIARLLAYMLRKRGTEILTPFWSEIITNG